ncbi:MAG: transposase, family [Bacteroidetes bacterium]|nr:transposase, family [Bacteroidota bacterium]
MKLIQIIQAIVKAVRSNKVVSSFAGVAPVLKRINALRIPETIQAALGERPAQARYSYSDVMVGWMVTSMSHGTRLIKIEDAKKDLALIQNLKLCSHDTVGRVFKKFATPNEEIKSINPKNPNRGEKQYFKNENDKLNDLSIQLSKKLNLLKENIYYELDMDATIIPSKVHEARPCYKSGLGFTPMVCMINQIPVYVSMRSGNANSLFMQLDCLKRCLALLKKHNIKVGRVRIDGAGFTKEILKYLNDNKIKFVVGADWSERTHRMIMTCQNPKKVVLNTTIHRWNAMMCSVPFTFSNDKKNTYRMIAIQVKKKDRELEQSSKWRLKNGYYYKFVITNDEKATEQSIMREYHQRGAIEKNFDALKNNFGWAILPFSRLNENLVHLIISGITNNLYLALLKFFSKKIKELKITFRLPKFLSEFLRGAFSYEEDRYVFYDSKIDYVRLM